MRAWKHEIWAYFYMAGISRPGAIKRAKFILLVKKKEKCRRKVYGYRSQTPFG